MIIIVHYILHLTVSYVSEQLFKKQLYTIIKAEHNTSLGSRVC